MFRSSPASEPWARAAERCVCSSPFLAERHMRHLSSTRPSTRPSRPRNRLLAALAPAEFKRLRVQLEPVDLSLRDVVSPAAGLIAHVYFPEAGMVSLIQRMADGAVTEVGL